MPDESRPVGQTSGTSYPSATVAWTTVSILSLAYMFSIMDRQILVLLVDPIKADLGITDTQISLLTGFAFAVVYSIAAVPMGRAADIRIRKHVIIFGVTVWSLLTIACGFARNFIQLFLARMGVGFGEAALTPTAYSMVGDLFPPERLARGMSVFVLGGIAAGGAMSLFLSGVVIGLVQDLGELTLPLFGTLRPWQLVLVIVGVASLCVVIPLSVISEPKRHGAAEDRTSPLRFRAVLGYMWKHRAFYGTFILGICIANLMGYGRPAWIPTYFIRVLGWDAANAGINLGLLYLTPALIGGIVAGWLADRLYGRGYRQAPLSLMVVVIALAAPMILLFIYTPLMEAKLVLLVTLYLLETMFFVLFPTIVLMATPNHIRAQVSAIHLLIANLVGIGLGPTTIAMVTDYGFQDDMAVGHSIAIVGTTAYVVSAIILWFSLGPYKQQMKRMTEAEVSRPGRANTQLDDINDANATT